MIVLRKICFLFFFVWVTSAAFAGRADTLVVIDANDTGLMYEGAGAISASSTRLLYDYPEPERSRILDYLFTPAYGGAMQLLKVEIGSDMNSTDLAEPSHMRVRGVIDEDLGFEWWLMEEAKKRNPDIKLYALAWGSPGWVGDTFWTDDNIYYLMSWLDLAHDKGFVIDYVGGWNERGWDADWYVKFGRELKVRFPHTKLVAADDVHKPWSIAFEMDKNRALREVVDIVGVHSPCGWRTDYKTCTSPEAARNLPQPLWNSEHSSMTHDWGAWPMARAMNRLYLQSGIVANMCWSLVSAWYSSQAIADTGLMLAEWPWSGYYQVGKSIWVYAHTTQFTEPGWQHMDKACGFLPNGASYVTRKSPDRLRFSTVVETCDAQGNICVEFAVSSRFPTENIYVWSTDIVSDDDNDHFILSQTIRPENGRYMVTFEPGRVYTITNTTGQAKGTDKPRAKIDDMMDLPYSEDFESYGSSKLARFFCDLGGGYQTYPAGGGRSGMAYRQMVKVRPVSWTNAQLDPSSIFGDPRWWGDYEISADVLLEEPGYLEILGRIAAHQWGTRISGYHLRLHDDGKWVLYRQDLERMDAEKELASGKVRFGLNKWNRLGLRMTGNQLEVMYNGKAVGKAFDDYHISGQAGVMSSQWVHAQFDNVSVRKTAEWPVYVPVADKKIVAFTSEEKAVHRGYSNLAANAIDGRPETTWFTKWKPQAGLPQYIVVDLGRSRPVKGVVYQPRRETMHIHPNTHGFITKCNVYVSENGTDFIKAGSGEWPISMSSRFVGCDTVTARYVKFEAVEATNNDASIGELEIVTE